MPRMITAAEARHTTPDPNARLGAPIILPSTTPPAFLYDQKRVPPSPVDIQTATTYLIVRPDRRVQDATFDWQIQDARTRKPALWLNLEWKVNHSPQLIARRSTKLPWAAHMKLPRFPFCQPKIQLNDSARTADPGYDMFRNREWTTNVSGGLKKVLRFDWGNGRYEWRMLKNAGCGASEDQWDWAMKLCDPTNAVIAFFIPNTWCWLPYDQMPPEQLSRRHLLGQIRYVKGLHQDLELVSLLSVFGDWMKDEGVDETAR